MQGQVGWGSRARRPWERQAGHAVILLSHPEHLTVYSLSLVLGREWGCERKIVLTKKRSA